MTDLKEAAEEAKPAMAFGFVPNFNEFFCTQAWKVIKPHAQKIVDKSMGEENIQKIWNSIFYGSAHLYMVYLDRSGKVTEKNQVAFVLDRLAKSPEEDWMGYMLIEWRDTAYHLWHVYIDQKFQGTNAFRAGFDWVIKDAQEKGSPYISFNSYRDDWEAVADKLGFEKTYSVYRKKLKE